jgi:uncharacterized membrane protein YqjE
MSNKNRLHDWIATIALILLLGFLFGTGKVTMPSRDLKVLKQSSQ